MLVTWTISKEQNMRIFELKESTSVEVFAAICDDASIWIMAGAKPLEISLSRD
jgi:hypothetical protein